MNSLSLGLIAAGAALVIGVVIYNAWQIRRARRRARGERAELSADTVRDAGGGRAEPAFGMGGDADPKAMPQSASIDTEAEEPAPEEDPVGASFAEGAPRPLAARASRDAAGPDPDIECVVLLRADRPVATAALAHGLASRLAKPVRWLGRSAPTLPWRAIDASLPGPWQEVAACMLLADRGGPASRDDLEAFLRTVDTVAANAGARCEWPDENALAERAMALDRLCADLDVQIGLTILKGDGQIPGTKLRGVAEAAGFRLTPAGQFDYVQEDTGAVLCSLQNYQPEPFTAESLRGLSVPGVVLLLDVPRVAEPTRAFDQMRLIAKRLAQTLEGTLVDDNRRPLDDAALGAIRGQVQATAAALREAQIEPGGARALRLFG